MGHSAWFRTRDSHVCTPTMIASIWYKTFVVPLRAACVRAAPVAGWGRAPRPSADVRERLVMARDAGVSPGEAARLFGVDRRTVFRWRAGHRRGESLAEKARSGRPPKLSRTRYAQVRAGLRPSRCHLTRACRAARHRHGCLPQPLAAESAASQAWPAAQKKSRSTAEQDGLLRRVARGDGHHRSGAADLSR